MVARGCSYAEITKALGVSPSTVAQMVAKLRGQAS
jgi:Mn-dependent DtxR family transcriptional regulator